MRHLRARAHVGVLDLHERADLAARAQDGAGAQVAERAHADAVLEHAVGAETASRVTIFAGDIVPAKKPDPAIYLLTVERLGLDPNDILVVEDSRNGLLAADRAGLSCLVTVSGYTRDEGFDEAVLVVSEIGDPGRPPIEVIANRGPARPGDYLTLDDLGACAGVRAPNARPAARSGSESAQGGTG